MNAHIWRLVACGLVAAVLVGACAPQAQPAAKPQQAQQAQDGGVLRVVENSEGGAPLGTPWEIKGIDTKLPKPAIETLLREDANGNYTGWLAESWTADTATNSLTLSLAKGVKFQDDTDFNAEAVKWNFERQVEAKNVPGWLSFDVVDANTLRINFDQYQNIILYNLASLTSGGMISPTAFNKNGLEWARSNPVGTGPFKLQTFERGSKLRYTKWPGYWKKGLPHLDGIEFLFIRDSMTQQTAMQAKGDQRVDVLASTSGEQAATLKAQGLNVLNMPVGPVSLIPDSKNSESPLSKAKVREAISYAIDREGIAKARGFGYWQAAYQLPNPGSPSYLSDFAGHKYDPARAKQLLAEAGLGSGFKTRLIIMPALVDKDAMTAVQANLAAVGIQVDLETPDNGGYTQMRFGGGWTNGFLAQHTRALATFNITYNFYFPEATQQFPSLKRPDGFLDKLAGSLKTPAPDPKLGQELTRILVDDSTVIPVYYVSEMYALQPNVRDSGYNEWSSSTISTLEKAWLSK
jgi:peptide/nickel transport system substrate-binding protein